MDIIVQKFFFKDGTKSTNQEEPPYINTVNNFICTVTIGKLKCETNKLHIPADVMWTQFYKPRISPGDIGPNGPNITALCSKLNGPVTRFANKLATKVFSSLQDQWNGIRTKESFLITLLNCIVDGINAINNEVGNAMQI